MKKRAVSALIASGMVLGLASSALAYEAFRGPLGVLYKSPEAVKGYVIITPYESKTTYLIDMDGYVINEWKSDHIGFYAELLPNGNMARHGRVDGVKPSKFGGTTGILEEFDWAGNKVWEYAMMTPDKEVSHHTFEVMPNGNYMILGWEYKSYEEALAKGMDPNAPGRNLKPEGIEVGGERIMGIWPDFIREVSRTTGETVWEWHVWDHIGTGKDQIDINKYIPPEFSPTYAGPDWTHFNGVAYNPRTNQICVTSRNLGEVFVIDYATGKITYRWGNPANYGAGRAPDGYSKDGDQKLFGPHAPDWTDTDTITILDNGSARPSDNYTRAVELDPRKDEVVWEWKPTNIGATVGNFYSKFQSGAQKMANGYWMITTTNDGHVIQVKPDKTIVWEFVNPVNKDTVYPLSNHHGAGGDNVHKAIHYTPDWPGFAGKDMKGRYQFPNWTSRLVGDTPPLRPMQPIK